MIAHFIFDMPLFVAAVRITENRLKVIMEGKFLELRY
ncbi:hypothetical protein PB1_12214 [Bacillus methanolicus PB1]|uniref:Uncharacterized protein n=1 Tax=Bacillus methanolicus PB1 TaxID=997296 RepID=I3DVQ4_BACMT|nr:hypothetical protein PB1_12214 [Bacillus methanolicus PB1]